MKEKPDILICLGSSCFARGNEKNLRVIENFLEQRNLKDEVDIKLGCSLCRNLCNQGPILVVNDRTYTNVDAGMTLAIMKDLFK